MMLYQMSLMPYRRMGLHPVNATKNISEGSGILAATTNTVTLNVAVSVESSAVALSDIDGVAKNSSIRGFYLSLFFYTEGGEVANEVPLVDWYVIKDNGGNLNATGFTAAGLPTPGATGSHENKRFIFHTEKGLSGGGDASLSGVPMVFKGVIGIPKGMQTMRINDRITIVARANFATKFCAQAIYKWYQ